jgi:hypothetical protein
MYNNSDYGNILMIIYLSSLRHARAAGRSLVTPRSKALKAFCKGMMWITYQQPVDNSNTLYSTTTERQRLPVIIAGHRQILPVLLHYSTYLLGL